MMMQKLPGKEIIQKYLLKLNNNNINNDNNIQIEKEEKEINIKLFVDMNVGIGGDIWPAAQCFCRWILLDIYYNFFDNLFKQKRVIELGSGNALVSILVEKAFHPKEIIVTDLLSHVPLIEHNLNMNECLISKAASLDWLDEKDMLSEEPFDVILALEW
jgi:hypothetical protein